MTKKKKKRKKQSDVMYLLGECFTAPFIFIIMFLCAIIILESYSKIVSIYNKISEAAVTVCYTRMSNKNNNNKWFLLRPKKGLHPLTMVLWLKIILSTIIKTHWIDARAAFIYFCNIINEWGAGVGWVNPTLYDVIIYFKKKYDLK
jgi:hypothetical protein